MAIQDSEANLLSKAGDASNTAFTVPRSVPVVTQADQTGEDVSAANPMPTTDAAAIVLLTGTAANTPRDFSTKVIPVQSIDDEGSLPNYAVQKVAEAAIGGVGDVAVAAGAIGTLSAKQRLMTTQLAAVQAAVASGLPTSGEDLLGAADNTYATVVTAPARQCHYIHVAIGDGGARISLDGGTTVHFYVPANTERLFSGLVIPSGAVIQAKKLVDGGTQYTNAFASVW